MKKTLFLAAIVTLAACGEKKADGAAADSTATAAPAAAPTDTTATMSHDTASMHHDSTMARDTAKAKK
jgi:uncharacterized lipoprotein YajG